MTSRATILPPEPPEPPESVPTRQLPPPPLRMVTTWDLGDVLRAPSGVVNAEGRRITQEQLLELLGPGPWRIVRGR